MEKANKAYHLGLDLSEFAKAAAVLFRHSVMSSLMFNVLHPFITLQNVRDLKNANLQMNIFYHGLLQSRAMQPRTTVLYHTVSS